MSENSLRNSLILITTSIAVTSLLPFSFVLNILLSIGIGLLIIFIFNKIIKKNVHTLPTVTKTANYDDANSAFFNIFGSEQCVNFKLPSTSILTNNTINFTKDSTIKTIANNIIDFYRKRDLIIEYRGFDSAIKLDTLKFADIKTTSGKQIKFTDITKYETDLARMLMFDPADIKFLSVIPGEQAFGITIPNNRDNNVRIKNIFDDSIFQQYIKKHQKLIEDECYLNCVPIVLGADSKGFVYFDMVNDPHALIAGASGSGKSVCINTILTSLLMLHTPESLHLYLADLKGGIELYDYRHLPHTKVFADDITSTNDMLTSIHTIMQERFKKIRPYKSIVEYNQAIRKKENFIPFMVVVVDEFISLATNKDVMESLIQISAMARAAGIFLILSTQKPTKNVVDTRIKANLTARICFRTADDTESRVVLDTSDAAELMGGGDGIVKTSKSTLRFQGCYVDRTETTKILEHWAN